MEGDTLIGYKFNSFEGSGILPSNTEYEVRVSQEFTDNFLARNTWYIINKIKTILKCIVLKNWIEGCKNKCVRTIGRQAENASETSLTWNTLALTLSFLFLRLRSAGIVVIETLPQSRTIYISDHAKPSAEFVVDVWSPEDDIEQESGLSTTQMRDQTVEF